MKETILIISYDYAPLVTPNAFRWSGVAESLAQRGYRVFVVCGWKPQLPRHEVVNGVHVVRVGGRLVETVRAGLLQRRRKDAGAGAVVSAPAGAHASRGLAKKVHDLTWKKVYWPDYACTWYLPALAAARRIVEREGVSRYITVSIPFTPHLIGRRLKAQYPGTTWVVDISDPFCFLKSMPNNNHRLYAVLNEKVERRVFAEAQAISVLTRSQKERYSELFPESAGKIFVNPNILTLGAGDPGTAPFFPEDGKMRLIFIGMLKKGVRTPEHLLQLFELLTRSEVGARMELHFFGGLDYLSEYFAPYQELVGTSLFLHGVVPRATALRAMYGADVLVNIGNSNPYQEPSKVVEYASTGKPILNIACIENDSAAALLRHYPAVCNVWPDAPGYPSRTVAEVLAFLTAPPAVRPGSLDGWLASYRAESVVDNYQAMLCGPERRSS